MLQQLVSTTGVFPLTGSKIRLFSGSTTPTPDSVVADFTPATFSGYADVLTTFTVYPVNIGASIQGLLQNATFGAGIATPFVPDTITGYIVLAAGGAYFGGERFSNPIPIAKPGDFLDLAVMIPLSVQISVDY